MIWPLLVLTVLGAEWGRQVWRYFRANKPLDAAAVMGIGMIAVIGVLYGWYLPIAKYMQISPQIAQVLHDEGATKRGDVLMIDYKEPSLAFYQGGTIEPQRDNAYVQNTPPEQWPTWLVITKDVWRNVPKEIQSKWDVIAMIHGWSYADGSRIVDVMVIRKR
jgi:hypothetical protein